MSINKQIMFNIFKDMSDKEKKNEEIEEVEETQQEEGAESKDKKEKKKEKHEPKKTEKEKYEETISELNYKIAELNDKHLRLYSEFDNYRKRTSKERIELSKTASEEMILNLLPVLDDFERAMKAIEPHEQTAIIREGVELIYIKMFTMLQAKGLKPMESIGTEFDPEIHEAIAQIPAQDDDSKGKVIDEVEKGYYLNDKLIRYAKVIVAI